MKTQPIQIPVLTKNAPNQEVKPQASGCCTPKDNASVCCTPSESKEENNGACCAQPEDGSSCCNK